jgi:hypothetical protein
MNNPDTELLFPMRAISSLSDLRGDEWQNLVRFVSQKDDMDPEKIAFSALIIKLAGCVGCSADSFRALRGCTQCSKLVIKRYKGTDSDLSKMYEDNRFEVGRILEKRNKNRVTKVNANN